MGGLTQVLISPDGQLGSLPFASLPGREPGSYLIDRYTIGSMPVPRLLPRLMKELQEEDRAKGELLLLGGVDYDEAAGGKTKKKGRRHSGESEVIKGQQWGFLDGSLSEVGAIESLYRDLYEVDRDDLIKLTRKAATEQRLRELAPGYEILHLATHGFFAKPEFRTGSDVAEDEFQRRSGMGSMFSNQAIASANSHNPGILSGLVLAGANKASQATDADDGIMTAQEISYLPLRGTKLVTLSACETGLGKVADREGLIGIQRAFQVSGAKTVIATTWKVDDKMTQKLMELFYRNYFEKKMGKLAALRAAQLSILNDPDAVKGVNSTRGAVRDRRRIENSKPAAIPKRTNPYYWAPFILSGDWR